jgi:hypothetical protein
MESQTHEDAITYRGIPKVSKVEMHQDQGSKPNLMLMQQGLKNADAPHMWSLLNANNPLLLKVQVVLKHKFIDHPYSEI